ncbi:MAG: DNA polymerase III subunit alpha [Candidatus Acidiferrales bacterium]
MYVELHARSAFSFLEGASQPEELAEVCAELGLPAMALLDRDGVYGAPRFHLAAKRKGIRAHIGAEVTAFCDPARTGKNAPTFRYPLLVTSRTGYQNLCRLITRMKMHAPKNAPPEQYALAAGEVREYATGLICLTGGDEGPLAAALAREGFNGGENCVRGLCEIFGRENVYVELQRHFMRREEQRNHAAVRIARKLGLPLLATGGVSYAAPPARQILDVFTCIRHHKTLENAGRLLERNSERHLKPAAEMARLFADLPEAIASTQELSARLQFTLEDLGYQFPKYPVPPSHTQISFLRERTREGMITRYGTENERARKQIERELALIEKLDLAGYFLIVWDIVRYCREQNILVQGRGSAANSAVCYSLGLTAVDPVGMGLLFERFLSEERGEWPDIDLDLPSGNQRERAIQYVYERYGKLGAAMTANVITYRGRSAAREVGKTLGFNAETLDRLSKLVSAWEFRDPDDTLQRNFRDAGFDLTHPRIRKFFELCQAVQDLPRHLGQHSGGMVVCQGQLDAVVPLEPATMPGRVVIQWDKEDCADMGIVKVDLLGLGMMAVLEESIQLIRAHHGEEVDLAHLPPDDPQVYDALCRADTVGMFQVESRAQMSCLPRLRPKRFYDIVVQVAIIRPGPIVGQMVNPFIKRRQGREPVDYLHPSLQPVLERTLGVPLFQEQLLRMAMIAAGFSGGQAEELRRAFGFKRSERRMREVEVKLREGMNRNGINGPVQDRIIQAITSFALYGFPESHAASFALIAYASAWLKCHYLAAFTAALLNNQPMGFYAPATVVKDAQVHGLKVRPIDVTCSEWLCTLEGRDQEVRKSGGKEKDDRFAVRLGLRYAKGLHEATAVALVRERRRAAFASIDDLKRRVPEIQKDELVLLAEIGALNSIGVGADPCVRPFAAHRATNEEQARGPAPTNGNSVRLHRRSALWQVERAARPAGPLLDGDSVGADPCVRPFAAHRATNEGQALEPAKEGQELGIKKGRARGLTNDEGQARRVEKGQARGPAPTSPLEPMSAEERLVADFRGTGLTVGPHPMRYRRAEMNVLGVTPAALLRHLPNGRQVSIAGGVIARQRPGTAKGFVFLSLEDETGISNAILTPNVFDRNRLTVVGHQFLLIRGKLQNLDGVISVKADHVQPLEITQAATASHDFH